MKTFERNETNKTFSSFSDLIQGCLFQNSKLFSGTYQSGIQECDPEETEKLVFLLHILPIHIADFQNTSPAQCLRKNTAPTNPFKCKVQSAI